MSAAANPLNEGTFETESATSIIGGGMRAVKSKVDGLATSVSDKAKQGFEEASKVKELKKYLDLDLAVFPSTADAEKRQHEQDQIARAKWGGLLHPETFTSAMYNQMHLCFLVYMLIVLPRNTAFGVDPSPGTTAFAIDVIIDVFIFLDIILNFRKYMKDGPELITDPKRIRREYLRGWFVVDFLSVLPFNYIMLILSSNATASNFARSARFLRLIRIARFVRLIKLAKLTQLKDAIRSAKEFLNAIGISAMEVEFALRMVGLVLVMLGIGHVIACLWLYIGRSGLEQQPPEGWMVGSHEISRFALDDGTLVLEEGKYVHEQYVDAFYWAIVTMSSVGYGDVLPTTTSEREVAVIVITIGAFLYAYIIGAFSTIMAALSHDEARYDTKMRVVANYLKFLKIDSKTVNRVTRFYEFRFANKIMFKEDDIVDELPPKLKAEIVLQRFQKTVDRIPFFRGLNEDVITAICIQFREFAVLPGDFIMLRGDPYTELVVLTKGQCRSVPAEEDDVVQMSPRSFAAAMSTENSDNSDGDEEKVVPAAIPGVIEYPAGSFFGELEFLTLSDSRPTTIRAKTYCELSSLHPADISNVVESCDALKSRMAKYIELKQVLATENCGELDAERRKQETEEEFDKQTVDNVQAAQAVDFNSLPVAKMLHMLAELTKSNAAIVERLGAVEAAVGIG